MKTVTVVLGALFFLQTVSSSAFGQSSSGRRHLGTLDFLHSKIRVEWSPTEEAHHQILLRVFLKQGTKIVDTNRFQTWILTKSGSCLQNSRLDTGAWTSGAGFAQTQVAFNFSPKIPMNEIAGIVVSLDGALKVFSLDEKAEPRR